MQKHTSTVLRRLLPRPIRSALEGLYRRVRAHVVQARYGYPARSLRVIAVTGTNGKTTTACFMNEILKEAGMRTALFTSAVIEVDGAIEPNELNATVPTIGQLQRFFVRAKRARVDYVILEVTSHSLDQFKLEGIRIIAAVMTNLTHDHLDYHGSMTNYAKTKGRLFARTPDYITLNADDEWYDFFYKYPPGHQRMSYGTSREADTYIKKVTLYPKGSEATVVFDHQTELVLTTALPGKYNVYNMVAAATTAFMLGVKLDHIIEGVANLERVPGRFEYIEAEQPYRVVVDYAHTPDAIENVLTTARGFTKRRVTIVFGATGDRDTTKRPLMGELAAKLADKVIITDDESYNEDPAQIRRQVLEGARRVEHGADLEEYADRKEAIKAALEGARRDDIVIVAGLGHEKFRIRNGERIPWDDATVIRAILTSKETV